MSAGFRVELRRRFICEACGKSYASSGGVRRHLPCWMTPEAKGCGTCAHKTLRTVEVESDLGPAVHVEHSCRKLGSTLERYERNCPIWQIDPEKHELEAAR